MPKYFCEKCNYSTDNKQNYDIHCISKKHNKINTNENIYDVQQSRLVCDGCQKTFANKSSLDSHKNNKRCKRNNIILNNKEKEKRTCKNCGKIFAHQSGLSQHKHKCIKIEEKNISNSEEIKLKQNNDTKHDENVQNLDKIQSRSTFICDNCKKSFASKFSLLRHKENNKCKKSKVFELDIKKEEEINKLTTEMETWKTIVVAMTTQNTLLAKQNEILQNQNKSNTQNVSNTLNVSNTVNVSNTSNYNFALIHFPNAPLLKAIPEDCYPEIGICDIIHEYEHSSLPEYIGKHMISYYKKEEPAEQSFWNTDKSRENYIVREETPDKKIIFWNEDPSGVKVKDCVVVPFLKYLKIKLQNFMNTTKPPKTTSHVVSMEYRDKLNTIMTVVREIDDNTLLNNVLTYITPTFHIGPLRKRNLLQNTETQNNSDAPKLPYNKKQAREMIAIKQEVAKEEQEQNTTEKVIPKKNKKVVKKKKTTVKKTAKRKTKNISDSEDETEDYSEDDNEDESMDDDNKNNNKNTYKNKSVSNIQNSEDELVPDDYVFSTSNYRCELD